MHISYLSLLATGDDHAALSVRQHFPSEKWRRHEGHDYGKPDPGNVSYLVRDVLLVLVDYYKSLELSDSTFLLRSGKGMKAMNMGNLIQVTFLVW
jgi:hypothetical protein